MHKIKLYQAYHLPIYHPPNENQLSSILRNTILKYIQLQKPNLSLVFCLHVKQ